MRNNAITKGGNHLGEDDITRLVFRLAIPAMLAQFVNVLYSIIDRIYIGNIPQVGDIALAGAGICGPIVTMISAFAGWIGIGGAPLMSIKMGAGNEKEARKVLANAFLLLLLMAFFLTFLGYFTKVPLLQTFGTTSDIFPYANAYMSVYLIGTPFVILSMGLNQFIICQGYSGLGMCTVIVGAICNIVLDPIFIFGLDMGVSGAALATVIAQALSCLFTLIVLWKPITPIGISFGGYDLSLCRKILVVGLTPFLIILFDNILIVIQNMMMKLYGQDQANMLLTCNTIVQSFMLIISMPLSGITSGTQSILGYNYGAGNHTRIKKAVRQILLVALCFCTFMFFVARFASHYFVLLFTKDPFYIEQTVRFIQIYTFGIIPMAVQYAFVDGLTGMSISWAALPLSFLRKLIYIALVVFLAVSYGAQTIFYAEPISDFVAPTITAIAFFLLLPKILSHAGEEKIQKA